MFFIRYVDKWLSLKAQPANSYVYLIVGLVVVVVVEFYVGISSLQRNKSNTQMTPRLPEGTCLTKHATKASIIIVSLNHCYISYFTIGHNIILCLERIKSLLLLFAIVSIQFAIGMKTIQ